MSPITFLKEDYHSCQENQDAINKKKKKILKIKFKKIINESF